MVKNVLDNDGELSLVQSARCGVVNGVTATCSDPQGYFSYAKNFTYNAAGAVTSMQLGNGRWETTQFNSRLQPTQIGLGTVQNATDKLKLDYEYGTADNNGNITKQTITVPTVGANAGFTAVQDYTYDELNRLKGAVENVTPAGGTASQSWKQTFTFDRYGNRRFDEANTTMPSSFVNPAVTNPTIGASNNRLTSPGYSYDASGNTTADANGQSYVYDAENKMISASNSISTLGEYFYDGDGKRVKKYVPSTGELTIFVYDAGGKLIGEYSTEISETPKVSYTTSDHLGSPRIITDENGMIVSRRDFMPFGEEIFRTNYGSDSIRQKFTGYERDDETSLDYAQARYHSANLGRFSSPDPYNVILEKERGEDQNERADILIGFISNPQRWNGYVYVVNNPLAFTDPDGQKPRTINVFLDAGVLTKEGLEEWQKWAASAQKKDKELTVNIYQIRKDTPGTINAFLDSLKAKDTATIFMGHSTSSNGQRLGIHFNTGGDIGSRGGGLSKTADGIDIQNTVLAVFSCGFGNGFDNIASSNGTAFVSIVQGPEPTTRSDATNAAAFRFAQSIAAGSWEPLLLPGNLNAAVEQGNSGIRANPSPDRPSVMAGDHVNYRILPPPRKKR